MNISAPVFVVNSVVRASFTVIVTAACFTAAAQTNSWTSPTSGNWEDSSSWSLGVPPGSGQTVLVENHGWKAVAVAANTAQNFPQTMTIDALRILSPGTDTVNSVLLNYAGLQTPLTIANDLDVSNNTSMVVLQSAVQANGGIWVGGTVTEDASSQVSALGLPVSGGAAYYLTNGTLSVSRTGYESLGGQFVQAGGSNFCGSLDVSGGEYDLSGGQLVVLPPGAPGEDGILVYGNFVQSGGTAGDWLSVGKAGVKGGIYELSGGFLHASFLALPTEPDNGTEPNPDSSEMSQAGRMDTPIRDECCRSLLRRHERDAAVYERHDPRAAAVFPAATMKRRAVRQLEKIELIRNKPIKSGWDCIRRQAPVLASINHGQNAG